MIVYHMVEFGSFHLDIASGIIIASIIAITTYLSNNYRNRKNENKRQNVLDNRFKEAILTLAEAFDSETIRLHPDQNVPLLKPRIERLVENGDRVF